MWRSIIEMLKQGGSESDSEYYKRTFSSVQHNSNAVFETLLFGLIYISSMSARCWLYRRSVTDYDPDDQKLLN